MEFSPIELEVTMPDGKAVQAKAYLRDNLVDVGSAGSVPGVFRIDFPLSVHQQQYVNESGEPLSLEDIAHNIQFAINDGGANQAVLADGVSFTVTEGDPQNPTYASPAAKKVTPLSLAGDLNTLPSWLLNSQEDVDKLKSYFPHDGLDVVNVVSNDKRHSVLMAATELAVLKVAIEDGLDKDHALTMTDDVLGSPVGMSVGERNQMRDALSRVRNFDELKHSLILAEMPRTVPYVADRTTFIQPDSLAESLPLIPGDVTVKAFELEAEGRKYQSLYLYDTDIVDSEEIMLLAVTSETDSGKLALFMGEDAEDIVSKAKLTDSPAVDFRHSPRI